MDRIEASAIVADQGGGGAASLFESYNPRLLRYMTVVCGDRHLAEDVVGDVWEEVVRTGAVTFDPRRGDVFGWLAGIARHCMWRSWRRTSREIPSEFVGERLADVDQAPAPVAGARSTEPLADDDQEDREPVYVFHAQLPAPLVDAMASLPPAQRRVMETVADGIPTPAAASWLGTAPGTVTRARYTAVRRLRAQLRDTAAVAA